MHSEHLQQSLFSVTAKLTVGAVNSLGSVLFIVRAGNDIVKADFMDTKRTNNAEKSVPFCYWIVLRLEKTNMFENADLYRTNW